MTIKGNQTDHAATSGQVDQPLLWARLGKMSEQYRIQRKTVAVPWLAARNRPRKQRVMCRIGHHRSPLYPAWRSDTIPPTPAQEEGGGAYPHKSSAGCDFLLVAQKKVTKEKGAPRKRQLRPKAFAGILATRQRRAAMPLFPPLAAWLGASEWEA